MSNLTLPQPKVIIDRMALEKIRYFVNKDSQECSGLGITRVVGDTIFVDEVQMLEQRNGAAHTDIDEASVTKLMNAWCRREGTINFWWHSHVNMSTFWSAQDKTTIEQLAKHGMCVASVFNKKGEIRTAVACKLEVPFSAQPQIVLWDELPLHAQTPVPEAIRQLWDQEHKDNVKAPVHTNWAYTGAWEPVPPDEDKVFTPITTKDPEFWDTYEQARRYDLDWTNGSTYDRGKALYRKSPKYLEAYAKWVTENAGKTLPPQPPAETKSPPDLRKAEDAEQRRKFVYAWHHDEIEEYDEKMDMFRLFTGVSISADWYMSDGCKGFREKTKENYLVVQRLEQERLLQLSRQYGKKTQTQAELELQREIDAYERDMGIRHGDIPDPNDLTENDLEALCKQHASQAQ